MKACVSIFFYIYNSFCRFACLWIKEGSTVIIEEHATFTFQIIEIFC